MGQKKTGLHKLDGCHIAPHRSGLEYYKPPSHFGPDQTDQSAAKGSAHRQGTLLTDGTFPV